MVGSSVLAINITKHILLLFLLIHQIFLMVVLETLGAGEEVDVFFFAAEESAGSQRTN